jgi:hypothetical protein
MKSVVFLTSLLVALTAWQTAAAEVIERRLSDDSSFFKVRNDDWQPEGFENGIEIPAAYLLGDSIVVDGYDSEAEWKSAEEVFVPLAYGSVGGASVKALYTDEQVFIRVRWPDATENREHHPWTWNADLNRYVSGRQVEDSILLSFEAGCEWSPSLLQGYVYDFDGWHWLAARSDPVGQAWDIAGTVQDRQVPGLNFVRYPARYSGMDWNVKFIERNDPTIIHDEWYQLDRFYYHDRAGETVYVRSDPDQMQTTNPALHLDPPSTPPIDPDETYPQFKAVRLTGDAGEVDAKGQWKDGYWTVEFRRDRLTPADTATDWVFVRLSQFSMYVFDGVEQLDQASESGRLFLRFLPKEQSLVSN